MLTISKDKSILIKGIVILMMVWLHLFNGNHTDLCVNLLCVGDEPFAKWLSNACGPVSFFLLLSGYGLAYTFDKNKLNFTNQTKRLFRLYAHYWVVLAVFLSVGWLMASERYPGSWSRLLLDASGWEYDYNSVMWFLLPYCMVSQASPITIPMIRRIGIVKSLVVSGMFYIVACYCISRYGSNYLYNNMFLYRPILFFKFLYPFTVGALFYQTKTELNDRMKPHIALLCLIVLVGIVATIGNAIVYMVYVPLMVWLLCQLSYPRWVEKVLMELGRKSMVIWMVHTWFCYYLFQPQVYSLRYPVLIMGGVLLVSYLTAIPILWTTKKILTLFGL